MKKFNRKFIYVSIVLAGLGGITMMGCQQSFLEKSPIGSLGDVEVASKSGVQELLIAAYAALDGQFQGGGNWESSGDNWVYGSVCGGDAHKGSDASDQADALPIARFETLPTNSYINIKWIAVYAGVARCNNVLKILPKVDISDADKTEIMAETRFLRGHYLFEAKKMWNMVPFIGDSIDYSKGNYKVPNDKDIWPEIEADLMYAYNNLPETQSEVGRANKWAAGAYLAKAYMFEKKYAEAKAVLDNVIANGQTSNGKKYALLPKFSDNFDVLTENSSESVFAIQASVNDGGGGVNSNWGDILNYPYNGGPAGCCGFFQPSIELANSYRTDAAGLPLLDGSYNDPANAVKNDLGVPADDPFTTDKGNLDPRIDWTIGRRGIPFLDWGPHPGAAWIRNQASAGPYTPKKNIFRKSEQDSYTDGSSWTAGLTAENYCLIRYADVLLWAAECEVEVGILDKARTYVNMIRERAANAADFVKDASGNPAANYKIGLYTTPWTDKAAARKAVHFERKLELAMEGHRFFDLVRWDEADSVLNAYFQYEGKFTGDISGAHFTKGKNEYFPLPQRQIDLSTVNGQPTLKQNPGY